MIRKYLSVVLCLFIPWQLQAAETPPVIEIFDCNYNSGQDKDDLDKAVEFWQGQIAKVEGSENYFAAVFSPIRASGPYDVHWVGANANLNQWAEYTSRFMGSDEGQASQARFDKVVSCEANLFFTEQVYAGSEVDPEDNRQVAEAYGCVLRHGKTMANVNAVEEAWTEVASSIDSKVNVLRWTPMVANLEYDLIYIIGHDDLAAFAANNTAQFNSSALSLAGSLLNTVMECKGGLYSVDVIQQPPLQE